MAPTEMLAEQHSARSTAAGRARADRAADRAPHPRAPRELLERLAQRRAWLIVGTHALIQDAVEFRALAVVVVDEQHRFGVRQRAALDAKGQTGWRRTRC